MLFPFTPHAHEPRRFNCFRLLFRFRPRVEVPFGRFADAAVIEQSLTAKAASGSESPFE